jgi:hypothetical protein
MARAIKKPASAFNFGGTPRIANCSGCLKELPEATAIVSGHWHLLVDTGEPEGEIDILILDASCSECWRHPTMEELAAKCSGCRGYWTPSLGITLDLWSRHCE